MKVAFIQPTPCSGTYKLAIALRSKGITADLFSNISSDHSRYAGFDHVYKLKVGHNEWGAYWDVDSLKKLITTSKPDILHTVNAPDSIVLEVKKLIDIPVAHSIHDLYSESFDEFKCGHSEIERLSFEAADGLINVSKYAEDVMIEKYPATKKKPRALLASYQTKELLPTKFHKKDSTYDGKIHIVYEGAYWNKSFRNYSPIFADMSRDKDFVIHIYPANKVDIITKPDNVVHHQTLDEHELANQLTRYNVGFMAFTAHSRLFHTALPNKLYEYHFSGLPVAAQPYKELANFIKQNPNAGFTWETVPELLQKAKEWRGITVDPNPKFLMENNVGPIIKMYEKLI